MLPIRGLIQGQCSIVRWSSLAPLGLGAGGLRPPYRGPADGIPSGDSRRPLRRISRTVLDFSPTGLPVGGGRTAVTGFVSL